MSDGRSAVFVGCAYECAPYLLGSLANLSAFADRYERAAFVFVENDSTDGTKQVLEEWIEGRRNAHLINLDGLRARSPHRTERLATARNAYMTFLRGSPYCEYSDLVVADLDDVNARPIDVAGFVSAREWLWSQDDVQAVFANTQPLYYDIWTLRHPTWCPNDCWAEVHEAEGRIDSAAAIEQYVYARQVRVPLDSEPIVVDSAFGGLGIYKLRAALEARYVGKRSDGRGKSDHVAFNEAVRSFTNGRLAIYPRLVNHTPPEHVRGAGSSDIKVTAWRG